MIATFLSALLLSTTAAAVSKDGRIVKGLPAYPGQFPHQAGLNIKLTYGGTDWCGGSLISDQWILTAAHCLIDAASAIVTLGTTNKTIAQKTFNVTPANMTIHAQYNNETLENDIALIKIPPVNFTTEILPIPLATNNSISYANAIAYVSGWGRIRNDTPDMPGSPVLNFARVQVHENSFFKDLIPFKVFDNQICILTEKGGSVCKYDSGGPMTVQDPNGRNILIGFTSFGHKSCLGDDPACFSRVTSFVPWIQKVTGLNF